MRIGPSEDGLNLSLDSGLYQVYQQDKTEFITVYRISKSHLLDFDKTIYVGEVDTSMCLFGMFDLHEFKKEFGGFEAIYEWGFDEISQDQGLGIFDFKTLNNNVLVCIQNESDKPVEIRALYSSDVIVGYEFLFSGVDLDKEVDPLSDYKFELFFRGVKILLYISKEYDDESIADTLIDEVRDLIDADDNVRISQMVSDKELEIEEHVPLIKYDRRLNNLEKINIISYEYCDDYEKDSLVRTVEINDSNNEFSIKDFVDLVNLFFSY